MNRIICWTLTLLLAGCSATERTSKNATDISHLARSSETRFVDIGSEARSESPDLSSIQQNATAGVSEQKDIQKLTDRIQHDIPSMVDVVPWWATLLGRLALVGGLIALIVLLVVTPLGQGVSAAVGSVFAFVSSLIPHPIRSQKTGEVLAKMHSDKDPMTPSEAVAAIRGMDPVADRSFVQAKKEMESKS